VQTEWSNLTKRPQKHAFWYITFLTLKNYILFRMKRQKITENSADSKIPKTSGPGGCSFWNSKKDRFCKMVAKKQYALVRPFLYFVLNFTSTKTWVRPKLYFDQNLTSTKTVLRPKLDFDQNFTSTKTLLRPKLDFDQNCTSTRASRPIK